MPDPRRTHSTWLAQKPIVTLALGLSFWGFMISMARAQVTPVQKTGLAKAASVPKPLVPPASLPTVPEAAQPPKVEKRRVLVNDLSGRPVVARVHGEHRGKPLIILPDGQLGFPDKLITTHEPFVPLTFDEVEAGLSAGDFAGYKVVRKPHYLIFTKASEAFTSASAKLLEDLYDELFTKLGNSDFAVHPPEFPLVAVIFHTEAEFRKYRPVDRDVQAYYEIFTNRIFLYEKSDREHAAPEVAAMRKPQTVAHEGAHQILHNIGVQPRLAPWPIWLVEGLAEYCSPPIINKKGQTNWAGLGMVHAQHVATIRDIVDGANHSQNVLARRPDLPMVQSLILAEQLTPTDYALAWSLTHYLATRRKPEFLKYLKAMGQVESGQVVTPEKQLADFEAAFGHDLFRIDREIVKHLGKLKLRPGEFLPFYAVMVQQPAGRGAIRRIGLVSQSPSSIQEWVGKMGEGVQWNVVAHPTKGSADTMIQAFAQGH